MLLLIPISTRLDKNIHLNASTVNTHGISSIKTKTTSPWILLVEDGPYFDWYVSALRAVGYVEGIDFETKSSAYIDSVDDLMGYDVVIWACGGYGYPSDDYANSEQAILSEYLDLGGSLIIGGQDIGFSIGDSSFYSNYLRAYYVNDNAHTDYVNGTPGTFMEGISIVLGGSESAQDNYYPDVILPINGAFTIMNYTDGSYDGYPAAIAYAGTYRLVYFAFAVEAINGNYTRGLVLKTAINFVMGAVEFLYPAYGSIICSKDFNVEFIIHDIGVDFSYAEVYVNASLVQNISPVTLEHQYTVSVSVDNYGAYQIRIDAYDVNGTKYSNNIIVYIDLNAPTISIGWPDDSTIGPANNTLPVNATDDILINTIKVYLNGTIKFKAKNIGLKQVNWNIAIQSDKSGKYNLSVVVSDYCGRKGVAQIFVFIDTSPPNIFFDVLEAPYKNRSKLYVKTKNITVRIILDDDTPIDYVRIYINDELKYNYTVDDKSFDEQIEYYINDTSCKFEVLASDKLGNTLHKTYTITYDPDPPSIHLLSPTNNSEIKSGGFWLCWDILDNYEIIKYDIYVNGEKYKELPGTVRSCYIKLGENGDYTIKLIAYDGANNTASITIIIKLNASEYIPQPKPSLYVKYLHYIVGSVIAIAIIAVLYISRRKRESE